ncbi:MAG: NAD(P)-binding domain-containing protein [Candidatus Marinimicrobia bacterium]|nr:NAD(P)-binding domain-containing protein [Candidatus Neomarinimicrobiota bacterium]
MAAKLRPERVIWLMIPHQAVDGVIVELSEYLDKGDLLVDGGNSNYKYSMRRADALSRKGIHYIDVGVSGGLAAAETGYCMMAGGDKEQFEKLEPAVRDMCVPGGYGHFGPVGAGHYVEMVHNAIEYGMMQAIG